MRALALASSAPGLVRVLVFFPGVCTLLAAIGVGIGTGAGRRAPAAGGSGAGGERELESAVRKAL